MARKETSKKALLWPLLLTALLLLSSCIKSEDGESIADASPLWEEEADMVLTGTSFTLYPSNDDPIEIKADEADFWSDEEKAVVTAFSFVSKDKDGNISMRGHADSAEIDTAKNIFTLSGNIELESITEELTVRTSSSLTFNADTEEITAPDEVEVSFSTSSFSGVSFYGNLKKEEYSFKKIEDGRIEL